MTRSFLYWSAFVFCGALSPAPSPSQSASPAPATSPAQPPNANADAKKTKKVWTNDDVNGLHGPVSVVGNSKNLGKGGPDAKADGQYIANTRQELRKLESQLDDTNKQLRDLKDFSEGKAPATSSGYPINKGYNRVPVDQQITSLEDKTKQLRDKIDALLDEARKKGVDPGDLR
jgi:vacuolar-type H+-ATPase subunit I/STV1